MPTAYCPVKLQRGAAPAYAYAYGFAYCAEFFKRVRVLKETGVKIVLAVGGWYDSLDSKYSVMVNSRGVRSHFVKHAVKFLRENQFDGLEVDWEFPKCWQVSSPKLTILYTSMRNKIGRVTSRRVASRQQSVIRATSVPGHVINANFFHGRR